MSKKNKNKKTLAEIQRELQEKEVKPIEACEEKVQVVLPLELPEKREEKVMEKPVVKAEVVSCEGHIYPISKNPEDRMIIAVDNPVFDCEPVLAAAKKYGITDKEVINNCIEATQKSVESKREADFNKSRLLLADRTGCEIRLLEKEALLNKEAQERNYDYSKKELKLKREAREHLVVVLTKYIVLAFLGSSFGFFLIGCTIALLRGDLARLVELLRIIPGIGK